MLLPITLTSQSLTAIINNSADAAVIHDLLQRGHTRMSVEETTQSVFKESGKAATSTDSTQVWASWVFNVLNTDDLNFICTTAITNMKIDLNLP